ncbi:hypothetical protein [Schlesneria sp.]|uniref:hypothetical protein n=1 Tax=Schlesneria sp. TaxID=2762018 RepID=UPI002EF967FD
MPERTVKGAAFTIIVDDKQIRVEHVFGKGKRCRVYAPPGVLIEPVSHGQNLPACRNESPILDGLRQSLGDGEIPDSSLSDL